MIQKSYKPKDLCICLFLWVCVRPINAQDKEEVSIEGTMLMLDDKTPHVACVVQAVIP